MIVKLLWCLVRGGYIIPCFRPSNPLSLHQIGFFIHGNYHQEKDKTILLPFPIVQSSAINGQLPLYHIDLVGRLVTGRRRARGRSVVASRSVVAVGGGVRVLWLLDALVLAVVAVVSVEGVARVLVLHGV
jgi:hypothetical protein